MDFIILKPSSVCCFSVLEVVDEAAGDIALGLGGVKEHGEFEIREVGWFSS
jgi:hypothetical protein